MPDDVKSMAVKMASMGLSVFFVQPDDRTPAQKAFYEKASNDPQIVAERFTDVDGASVNYNLGVLSGAQLPDGRKLHVIDVDVKKGKKGLESLEELKAMGLSTDTLTVRTPSGGLHLYYATPPDWPELGNTSGKLGDGIDTRGHHGYVVGPGSTIGGKPYELVRNGEILTLEPWMLEHLKIRVDRPDQSQWLCEPDLPNNVNRAAEHARAYPRADEGRRNEQLHVLAKDMRKFAVSKDLALELIRDNWPTAGELDEGELEKTVRSAYENGPHHEPAGIWSATAQFDDVGEAVDETIEHPDNFTRPQRKRRYSFLESAAMFRSIPPALVKDVLTSGSMSVFYGPPGAGKTFVVLDLAHAIASGRNWFGHKTRQGAVLYQVGEGGFGFHGRLEGLRTRYNSGEIPLFHYDASLDLFSGMKDAKDLVAECRAIKEETGQKVELIVIDTLARAMGGGDENSSQDIGKVIRTLDLIREHTGAHVLLVHHTGKDVSRGARGSNALKGAIDTEIEIIDGILKATRQRDLDSGSARAFKLGVVKIGADDDGADIITRIVEPGEEVYPSETDPPPARTLKGGVSVDQAQQILDAVKAAWDRGLPWNLDRTPDNKRHLVVNASVVTGLPEDKVRQLVNKWRSESCGILVKDRCGVGAARMWGYRVAGSLEPSENNVASDDDEST